MYRRVGGGAARSDGLVKRGKEVLPGKTWYRPAVQGMARAIGKCTSVGTDSSARVSFTYTSAALVRWSTFGWPQTLFMVLSALSERRWAGLWSGPATTWKEFKLRSNGQDLTGSYEIEKDEVCQPVPFSRRGVACAVNTASFCTQLSLDLLEEAEREVGAGRRQEERRVLVLIRG